MTVSTIFLSEDGLFQFIEIYKHRRIIKLINEIDNH